MPTYEYICKECGCKFEEFQSMTAEPLTTCKNCGKESLQRLIGTGAGIIFKGSGFYCTDYRSEDYSKAAKQETSSAGAGSKSSSGDKNKKESSTATAASTAATTKNAAAKSKESKE